MQDTAIIWIFVCYLSACEVCPSSGILVRAVAWNLNPAPIIHHLEFQIMRCIASTFHLQFPQSQTLHKGTPYTRHVFQLPTLLSCLSLSAPKSASMSPFSNLPLHPLTLSYSLAATSTTAPTAAKSAGSYVSSNLLLEREDVVVKTPRER